MNCKGLSKSQRVLLEKLGDKYEAKTIDYERCIYREFGDYDVEVSGGHKSPARFRIYVWQRKPRLTIVEKYFDVPRNADRIVDLLTDIANRYEGKRGEEGT